MGKKVVKQAKKQKVYVMIGESYYDFCQELNVLGVFTTKKKAKEEFKKALESDKANYPEKWEDELQYEREITADKFSIWKKNDYLFDHYEVSITEKELE